MSVSREELAAFADGELDPGRQAEVAAAVAADPALAREVEAHLALKARLSGHFAPILQAPLPDRLTAPLRHAESVVDLAAVREERRQSRRLPRWSWIVGPALAASIALAIIVPRQAQDGYAEGSLAAALDEQLVATQRSDAPTRILLSFRDEAGSYCRAFSSSARNGIACRDDAGWQLVVEEAGIPAQTSEYRTAGNPAARVLEQAQSMAAGPALDAAQERAARAGRWR